MFLHRCLFFFLPPFNIDVSFHQFLHPTQHLRQFSSSLLSEQSSSSSHLHRVGIHLLLLHWNCPSSHSSVAGSRRELIKKRKEKKKHRPDGCMVQTFANECLINMQQPFTSISWAPRSIMDLAFFIVLPLLCLFRYVSNESAAEDIQHLEWYSQKICVCVCVCGLPVPLLLLLMLMLGMMMMLQYMDGGWTEEHTWKTWTFRLVI